MQYTRQWTLGLISVGRCSAKELLRGVVLRLSVLLLSATGRSQLRGEWRGGPADLHQGLLAFNILSQAVFMCFLLFSIVFYAEDMQISWLRHLAAGFFAAKIQLTTPVLLRVVLQSMQIWPKSGQVQELIRSSLPVAVVILLTGSCACFLAGEVAALASFVGALLVNLTSIVIPCAAQPSF